MSRASQTMPNKILLFACLLGLLLLAFAIRTFDLDGKSIWSDEGLSLYRARHDVPFILSGQIIVQGIPTQDTQPPFYFLLLHGLITLAGDSTFVAKYFSVLAGLLTVPLLYVTGRRLLDIHAGLFAAMLGALSPLYLWYGQEIRMYTLLVTLSLASVYTLLRATGFQGKDPENIPPPPRKRPDGGPENILPPPRGRSGGGPYPSSELKWGLAYLLVTGAMIYTHYSSFFLLGFQGLYLLVLAIRQRRWWILAPIILAGLAALPVMSFVLHRLRWGVERDYFYVPLWIILRDLWNGFSLGISVDFYRVYLLDSLFLVVLIAGIVSLLRRQRTAGLFLLGYLFLPILALFTASHLKPMYQGVRHLIVVSPAYYLLLSAGLWALRRLAQPLMVLSVLLIGLSTGYSTYNYFTNPEYLKDDHRSLARYFQTHRGLNDILLLNDPVLTITYEYYLGEDAPIDAVPRYGTTTYEQAIQQIQELATRYDRLWFMSPQPEIRTWLNQHLFQTAERFFEGLTIPVVATVYESRPPLVTQLPPDLRGQRADLNQHLTFHGFAIPHNPIRAGEVLAFNLYWEPRAALNTDYAIVVNLLDDQGNMWDRGDSAPFGGFYPTSAWQPGQLLRQRYEMQVDPGTPPGVYHLRLRVYDPVSGDSLAGPGGETLINLGDIQVIRPPNPVPGRAVTPETRMSVYFGGLNDPAILPAGAHLRFLGLDLGTRVGRPGDEIPVTTYWQALHPLRRDYQVRLRLIGAEKRLLAEKTFPLSVPGYPTTQWRVGDVIGGKHRLLVRADAPPGPATLAISVVDPEGRPALVHRFRWIPIGGTTLSATTIEIVPREQVLTEVPPIQHPLVADLADTIELLGYDLALPASAGPTPADTVLSAAEPAVKAGDTLEVVLYWRGKSVMEGNLKVTVQVLSSDNQLVAQHDSMPANWARPTTSWLPGEIIIDTHSLTIDPAASAGPYRLIAAIYDPTDNHRLPVTQDDAIRDHIVLGTIVIR